MLLDTRLIYIDIHLNKKLASASMWSAQILVTRNRGLTVSHHQQLLRMMVILWTIISVTGEFRKWTRKPPVMLITPLVPDISCHTCSQHCEHLFMLCSFRVTALSFLSRNDWLLPAPQKVQAVVRSYDIVRCLFQGSRGGVRAWPGWEGPRPGVG